MKRFILVIFALVLPTSAALAQNRPSAQTAPTPPRQASLDLGDVGIQIKPEPRLIVVLAALDAAGFDPTPANEAPSTFRAQLRKDLAGLDPVLRTRLKTFYDRHKLRDASGKDLPAVEQATRYVSLAYVLGPAPSFESPPGSEDLPAEILDVLDFAPLLREFYRQSALDERMPEYLRAVQAEGDRMRRSTAEMARAVLSYLNTRPITTTLERVPVASPTPSGGKKKKDEQQRFTTREHERRFVIVPDLLAPTGAINFRVIADDYFVIVPYCDETKRVCSGRDNRPASPELARAYIQYVIDPLVVRFNRAISARRAEMKQILDARAATGGTVSADIYLTIARSLATAAHVRLEEQGKSALLANDARARLDSTRDTAKRAEILKQLEAARAAVNDEAVAQLAEGYENGAILSFYFAEQLRGVESSGFDVANLLPDMIASFDPVREAKRLEEADPARKRAIAARKAREAENVGETSRPVLPNSVLVDKLLEVDNLVRLKNYVAAEEQLIALSTEFPNEPRVFFSLAEIASRSASEATDEDVQSQRLTKALVNYRKAVAAATTETNRCLVLRAHEAMGRILEFMDLKEEAIKAFDAAIKINDTSCDAFSKAVEGKRKLSQP